MAKGSDYHVPFRRRREGKTNYHRRQRLLRSERPRLIIRRSNKHERVVIAEAKYVGDEIIVAANSKHLDEYGWKGATGNVPAAYLTGYLAGKYAQALGISEAILDIGVNTCRKETRVAAMLAGAVASGLDVPHDPEVFPTEERYTGKHIAEFAKKLKKDDSDKYNQQFSGYKKRNAKPESIETYFKKTLKAIDDEAAAGTMKTKLSNRHKKNKKAKPKTKKKTTTTKKKAPAKKAAPAKKKKAAADDLSVEVDTEIVVTHQGKDYSFDKRITMGDLKKKRVPNEVKNAVAKVRKWKTWKDLE